MVQPVTPCKGAWIKNGEEIDMRGFRLLVSGPMACYTRPELKVERMSYEFITPSAAIASLTAIFWKPAIKWEVSRIHVLNPIKFHGFQRNEVGCYASPYSGGINVEEERQQRMTLCLRDVAYVLEAEFQYLPVEERPKVKRPVPGFLTDPEEAKEPFAECEAKYAAMFQRRAAKGQCFAQPYLGCKEFTADFRLIDSTLKDRNKFPNVIDSAPAPISESRDFGQVFYGFDYRTDPPTPRYFEARMQNGIIRVPPPREVFT